MSSDASVISQFILPAKLPTDAELSKPDTLRTLAAWGRLEILKQLSVDFASFLDEDKNTLLHVAARHAQADVVRFLREKTTLSVGTQNSDGKTPLDLANGLRADRFNRAETISALTVAISSTAAKKVAKK
jgi:ankyrin repeat protein